MSLLWTLKKAFDPTKAKEQEDDAKEGREQDADDHILTGADVPEAEAPSATEQRYICQHCGHEEVGKNYCSDCLTFMEPVRDG